MDVSSSPRTIYSGPTSSMSTRLSGNFSSRSWDGSLDTMGTSTSTTLATPTSQITYPTLLSAHCQPFSELWPSQWYSSSCGSPATHCLHASSQHPLCSSITHTLDKLDLSYSMQPSYLLCRSVCYATCAFIRCGTILFRASGGNGFFWLGWPWAASSPRNTSGSSPSSRSDRPWQSTFGACLMSTGKKGL